MSASIIDYIKSGSLYFLPHHAVSRVIYKLTRIESRFVPKTIQIFSNAFKVNLDEAVNPDPKSYKSFNQFFTRELKPGLRPLADSALVSPVDGTVSQYGKISDGLLMQAKGMNYSLNKLLGGNQQLSDQYANGQFITIYLSPKDYHRIHMPCAGELTEQIHVPGRLFSVAPHTVKTVSSIFARNERVVAQFNTEYGPMAMVLVGAINVAAIETVWDGLITPPKGKALSSKRYDDQSISLEKGEEMGRFNMGSTVILVFADKSPQLDQSLQLGNSIRLGDSLSK